jgi:hypothetical protein
MVCASGLLIAVSYNLRPFGKLSGPVNPDKALRAGLSLIQNDLPVSLITMLVAIQL